MICRSLILASAGLIAALGQTPLAPATLSCPETANVVETATPAKGWSAGGGQVEHRFERVSIYNGKPGGQEYELAPDDEKQNAGKTLQTWKLKDYRTMNVFLRCRYHDTPVVFFMDLAPNLTTCTFTFALDKKGSFLGKSALLCR